jgi:GntR family transcriptional regulator of arabinose operon
LCNKRSDKEKENDVAKYGAILDAIRKEIADGKYDSDRQLPTESQLVARFKVSRPTVARALRELQNEGIVERRAGSGTYLKGGSARDAGRLGLIVPSLGKTEIFDPICAEIARQAQASHYALLWSGSWPVDPEARVQQAEELCHRYVREKVSGVFFAPVELLPKDETINQHIVSALDEAGIAVVLLDRDMFKLPRRSRYDLVGIDNFAAGFDLADHLIQLGCRRIAFVELPYSASTVDLRIAGWREAMMRAGLECGPDRVFTGDVSREDFVRKVLGRDRTEAIICANDVTAATLMQTLSRAGLKVPGDVRLVGFDDLRYASLLSVPLTTMHQPCQAIGQAAVEAMRERIRNPGMTRREILLDATLVIRSSCGAERGPAKPRGAAART